MSFLLNHLRVPLTWPQIFKRVLYEAFWKDNCLGLAAQLAYYFFFALFPALLFLIAVASYFPLETLIDDMFARRVARAEGLKSSLAMMRELQSIAQDFRLFKNVTRLNQRAARLAAQPSATAALNLERADEAREQEITGAILALLEELDIDGGVAKLKERVTGLLDQAQALEDSSSRRIARRVLGSLRASTAGVRNPELQTLLDRISAVVPR